MSAVALEIIFILLILLANGVFAMSEIAVVSARKAKLKKMADEGDRGAAAALELANSPTRFLSTVQVGITLVGIVAGAFGGARIASRLAQVFEHIPLVGQYSEQIAFFMVVMVITILSLIIGELIPKRIALNSPEMISSIIARPMRRLSQLTAPLVNVLSDLVEKLLDLMGVGKPQETQVSEDEVRVLIDEGLNAGVFHQAEKEMFEGVLKLDQLTVGDLMTPRVRIVWIDVDEPDENNWRKIAGSGHSHFPVFQGKEDNIIGLLSVKALWANLSLTHKVDVRNLVTPPTIVPESMTASRLIETFKKSGKHIALVSDEFGTIQGLVTLKDVLEAIVGTLPEREQSRNPKARKRPDGSWIVDAVLDIDEFKNILEIKDLPCEVEGGFKTVGGFILHQLGHIPQEGEGFAWENFRFEIIDMDRHRLDKILVTHIAKPKEKTAPAAGEADELKMDSGKTDKASV